MRFRTVSATEFSTAAKLAAVTLVGFLVLAGGLAFVLLPGPVHAASPTSSWYNDTWPYRKRIAIDSTKVGADLTDFPVLINLPSDVDLAARAQNDGDDLLITASDGTTQLNHEIEKFDGGTGELVLWVNVTSLSSSADTVLYLYYGNGAVGSQENATGVWEDAFRGVWHLHDDFLDSTSYTNDGANQGSSDATGLIADAQNFAGSEWVQVPHSTSLNISGTAATVSAWVRMSQGQPDDGGVLLKSTGSYEIHLGVESDEAGNFRINAQGAGSCRIDTQPLEVGVWYYLTGTYDGSTTRVYLNGTEEATCTSQTGDILWTTEPVVIGRRALGDNRWFYGDIDEPRMTEATRSPEWLLAEFRNQLSPSTFYTVGPEISSPELRNPGLVPISGDTGTFFNFTVDYASGNAPAAVKVNVSDATNSTYNNFTMMPIGAPSAQQLVQESWALTGSVDSFPAAQSSSDGGAAAVLQQASTSPPPSGFVWLDDPDEVSLGGTLGSWVENQDLADDGVPSEATGVILSWLTDGSADESAVVRGAEDTNDYMNAGVVDCEQEDSTWRQQIVKLGSNRYIDTWREDWDHRLYVMGYTLGTDPKFLTAPTDLGSLTADNTWHTLTVSVDADTDGVLLMGQVTVDSDTSLLVRAVGSSDSPTSREWEQYHCGLLAVKIDGSDQFEYRLSSGDTAKLWLVAETKGSVDWLDTDRTDISPSSSGWVTRDLDSYETVPYDASGVLLQFENNDASGCSGSSDCRFIAREEGRSWTFPEYDIGGDKLLLAGTGINPGNQLDIYQENASVTQVYTHAITRHVRSGRLAIDMITTDTGSGASLSHGHEIGDGPDRLLVVGVAVEGGASSRDVTDVTYNGVSLTPAVEHEVGGGTRMNTEIWYMLDSSLPSAGSYTITVTVEAAAADINVAALSLWGAAQQTPEATGSNDDGEAGDDWIETQITTASDEAWVFDVVGSGNAVSGFTPNTGQTEQAQVIGGTSGLAMGTKSSSPPGTETLNWTTDTSSNRISHVLAAFVPNTPLELQVQFNTTGIRAGGEDTLVLRYNLTSGDDTFEIWVWNFTASAWTQRGTIDRTVPGFLNYTLRPEEKSAGEVRMRFNDTSSSGGTALSVDYQLVNNTLWRSGVTFYYNTTLSVGSYSHFFWAQDGEGLDNRTAAFAGPTVVGLCDAISVVTSDPAGELWFNESVEPDGLPYTTQVNVSASFQTGATPALRVTNDGSTTCDITLRVLSNPGTGRTLKFNTTNNAPWPADSSREVPLDPSSVLVCSNVAPGGSCDIWLWADYENALGGQASLDVRVESQ